LTSVCGATKRSGEPCTASATEPDGRCWAHSPLHSEARKRNASRAGRARPSRDLAAIKLQLQDMADRVLAGELETGRASVGGQLLNTKLRALDLERRYREQDELLARLEALEREHAANARANASGAAGWYTGRR
jgi:hypothetical protein